MIENDDIVNEFLNESRENLDQIDRDLAQLENDPASQPILSSIFRTLHNIKGTTGFLGFSRLESVAHCGESLLSLLCDGKLPVKPEITRSLEALVDAVREMLGSIESTGKDGERDYKSLLETLRRMQNGQTQPGTASQYPAPTAKTDPRQETEELEPPEVPLSLGQILIKSGLASEAHIQAALEAQRAGDPRHLGEILVERGVVPSSAIRAAIEQQKQARAHLAASSVRVDVAQLDHLSNLIGELGLVRNDFLQLGATHEDGAMLDAFQRLNSITTRLREGMVKTRAQSIDNVWSKLPRMARDLAASCGKQVRVQMAGGPIELDRTIIEAIRDPFTHIVRNVVDHGIETPEKRILAGKPAEGRLLLRASREGAQVCIEIADDGAGVDLERVKQKAVERALITPEEAACMSRIDGLNLIFQAGVSTAGEVTKVSGRGVGMDVVRTNIEAIGGTIEVESEEGQGTTLKIRIPLIAAIIPAVSVACRGIHFAIPETYLLELIRLNGDEASRNIRSVRGVPVYRLRGNLLPLVYLERELDLPSGGGQGETGKDGVNIVALRSEDHEFGLVVAEITGKKEIAVRPLGKEWKGLPVYASAIGVGDGSVQLILDVLSLAQRARTKGSAEFPVFGNSAACP